MVRRIREKIKGFCLESGNVAVEIKSTHLPSARARPRFEHVAHVAVADDFEAHRAARRKRRAPQRRVHDSRSGEKEPGRLLRRDATDEADAQRTWP